MNFSQGHSGTEVRDVNRALFSYGKTPEFTKMGEIHELFVLALSLVWFAGATPDANGGILSAGVACVLTLGNPKQHMKRQQPRKVLTLGNPKQHMKRQQPQNYDF